MIAGCDAYVYERPDGTLGFKVGRYIEPTISLTEHDFYSLQISERAWGPQPPTEWVARYVEPDYDWNEAVTGVWVEDEDLKSQLDTVTGDAGDIGFVLNDGSRATPLP